uniref:thiosulfate sulfurtransferase n=1 Tax=Pristionchus pacificus TaxID=54126 RepID=A0A8R1V585_PRIPA
MSGALKKIIDAKTLQSLVAAGSINKEGIRLFDCTFFPTQYPDYRRFKEESYGKFPELIAAGSRAYSAYAAAHIPGAVHCTQGIATYPSRYERFTYYPADIFEQYIQLLGVHKDEHIIVYGRGPQGGMLFAGKVAWILKSYGQEKLSLLDGGLENWTKNKFELSNQPIQLPKGDWTAKDRIGDFNIPYEELLQKDADGKEFIEKIDECRFVDARVRGQFDGTEDSGLDPYVPATRIHGFTSMPSAELVNQEGLLKSEQEIKKMIPSGSSPVVAICNLGVQASLLSYVMDSVDSTTRPRIYPGSLKEMEKRNPKKISAGKANIPPQ